MLLRIILLQVQESFYTIVWKDLELMNGRDEAFVIDLAKYCCAGLTKLVNLFNGLEWFVKCFRKV